MAEHPDPDFEGGLLGALIDASHLLAPDEVPQTVARLAWEVAGLDVVLYLADLEQVSLVPLDPGDGEEREPLDIDGTLAGSVFRRLEPADAAADEGWWRRWVPLVDGTERVGVLEAAGSGAPPSARFLGQLAGLVAELVVGKGAYGDRMVKARRSRPLTLAAEMQWGLLPPLTFATSQVAIAGILQPSYRVAGDSFDYAIDDGILSLAILDAMGHGFEASLLVTVAVGAYRHARRRDLDLQAIYAEVDQVLANQFGPDHFATGVLARLDVGTGLLRWLPAGHPPPLLLRRGKVIGELDGEPATPMGCDAGTAEVTETSLEPGDRLLLYSDGVVEARAPSGDFFGLDRLAELLSKAEAAGMSMPETVRRLARAILDHQAGDLQDDATLLLVEWRGPQGR